MMDDDFKEEDLPEGILGEDDAVPEEDEEDLDGFRVEGEEEEEETL